MSASGSISFDGAASFYDKTRSLSPEAAAAVTELIRRELGGRGPVFEVGVGTGRIALPLNDAGVALVGLDLARNMLDRLIENAGGAMPFPLVQGDATRLPFGDGCFQAAIASWVLHLIPTWRDVLMELVRIVEKGGLLLIDVGSEHESILTKLTWKFRDVGNITDWPRGVKDYDDVDEVLASAGARARPIGPVREVTETTLERHIALLEQGIYSVSWSLEPAARSAAAAALRKWAAEELGPLNETRSIEVMHFWRAYDI